MSTVAKPVSQRALIEREKRKIMLHIKELQRDLIKASFQQSKGSDAYAEILQKINDEREKLRRFNERFSVMGI